jgi:hypothetical protein
MEDNHNKVDSNFIINNLLQQIQKMSLQIAILEAQKQEIMKVKKQILQTDDMNNLEDIKN